MARSRNWIASKAVLHHGFRDLSGPLNFVAVTSKLLTGFDATCLHTMYVDKPMQGHGLMQA